MVGQLGAFSECVWQLQLMLHQQQQQEVATAASYAQVVAGPAAGLASSSLSVLGGAGNPERQVVSSGSLVSEPVVLGARRWMQATCPTH